MSALALVQTYVDRLMQLADIIHAALREQRRNTQIIGEALREAEQLLPRRDFDRWVWESFRIKPRMARYYRAVSRHLDGLPEPERQRVAALPIRQVIKNTARPKDVLLPAEVDGNQPNPPMADLPAEDDFDLTPTPPEQLLLPASSMALMQVIDHFTVARQQLSLLCRWVEQAQLGHDDLLKLLDAFDPFLEEANQTRDAIAAARAALVQR